MFNTVTLSNGVRVVYEKLSFVRSIACGIWVSNGSRNENKDTNGMSHFIEHMLFKGTENRTAKEIADEMDAVGGQMNAFTSKEYTCYYTRVLYNHFDLAIDVLADMFFNSKFDNVEMDKERKVINEEIDMYEDTPEDLCHDMLQFNIFKGDSLSYPILGTKKSIGAFNQEKMKAFYSRNYHQDNIVVAVAGNFEEEHLLQKLEQYFGGFSRIHSYDVPSFEAKYAPCIVSKVKDIEQVHLTLGFPGIAQGADETYAMAILNTIFGGGMSSRLFQKIREEKGLSYSVYSYISSFKDTGLFSVYAGLNAAQTEQVIGLVIEEIKRLYTEKITQVQLSKTKEQLKSNYLLGLESSSNRMNSIGKSKLVLDRILSPDELIEKIDRVTLSDVYTLADRIFDLDQLSLSAVGNIEGMDFEEIVRRAK